MSDTPSPIARVIKRDGNVVQYNRDRIADAIFKAAASLGGRDRRRAEELARIVEDDLVRSYGNAGQTPTVEDIQDVVEAALMREGHLRTARAYIIYRHERARARESRTHAVEATDNIPYRKIYEVLRWNMDHGCETIGGLNRIRAEGRFPELVEAGEARYAEEVTSVAGLLMHRLSEVRIVIIAGPSSSGKTTTLKKIEEYLRSEGVEFLGMNIDHYFFDLEQHPRDEFGDYDYETPHALDLQRINRDLSALLDGEPVRTPHYDFKTGRRTLDVHPLALKPGHVLLIDSLHGLYEGMTCAIPAENKFRLYVETLDQIRNDEGVFLRWADHRLMRRMVRDRWHRNHAPMHTVTHWHYVRSSELQHIIPFIGTVDALINTALPYELPLLKKHVFHHFPEAMRLYRDDPKRQDAYIRARRLYEMLDPLDVVEDESVVPPRSLFREFIGGSEYSY